MKFSDLCSHHSDYEDCCFLGCDPVETGGNKMMFQMTQLPPSSGQMVRAEQDSLKCQYNSTRL